MDGFIANILKKLETFLERRINKSVQALFQMALNPFVHQQVFNAPKIGLLSEKNLQVSKIFLGLYNLNHKGWDLLHKPLKGLF